MAYLTLNDGHKIPIFGLGTSATDRKEGEVGESVKEAIKIGYRHIDTAYLYETEKEIGEAVEECINEGIVKREELFITTKIWMNFMRPDKVRESFNSSLKNLKLTYIDLYLIHWPMALKEDLGPFPKDADGNLIPSDVKFTDTWKELEKLVDDGLVKSIGVSNFNNKQLEELLQSCRIKPTMNQLEVHPYLNSAKLIDFCHTHDVHVTAYSPLGSPANSLAKNIIKIIEEPVVKEIAKKYGKSVGQVLIRYAIDRGIAVVPKSVTASRLKENFDVFDFKLSDDDLKELNSLNKSDGRVINIPAFKKLPNYPFHEDY